MNEAIPFWRARDRTGERFGRLVVLCDSGKKQNGNILWKLRCSCGNIHYAVSGNLDSGKVKSCGCLPNKRNFKHGMSQTSHYQLWRGMMDRCYDKKKSYYKYYGSRGIKVCRRWHKFENFFQDMGPRPKGKCLERIDNNGNYSLENCKWATAKEQANNSRANHIIEHNGLSLNMKQWSEKLGIPYGRICARARKGMPPNMILNLGTYTRGVPWRNLLKND